MAIKKYKPTSPGRRFMTVSEFDEITSTTPERSLLAVKKKSGGRNSYGRITVRHIGGGNRIKYRIIDWKRNKDGIPAKVASIQYDPNRSANIALLNYADGEKRYILAPLGLNAIIVNIGTFKRLYRQVIHISTLFFRKSGIF